MSPGSACVKKEERLGGVATMKNQEENGSLPDHKTSDGVSPHFQTASNCTECVLTTTPLCSPTEVCHQPFMRTGGS